MVTLVTEEVLTVLVLMEEVVEEVVEEEVGQGIVQELGQSTAAILLQMAELSSKSLAMAVQLIAVFVRR